MSDDLTGDLLDFHDETTELKADRQSIVRAPFGIPGTKTRSLPFILPRLPYRYKFIDHFAGSGIVTFNRQPSPLEVLNDRYGGIVAFYRCLKDRDKWGQMHDWLDANVHAREEFYYCKDQVCTETDDVIRAAKWYYSIRASVIGKGDCFARQTGSQPQFPIISGLKWFYPIHCRLQNIIIENLDFETCFNDFDSEDCVHYCDPPYIGTDPSVYKDKWTRDDLSRLLRCARNAKGFVALSGYADEQIDAESWSERHTWNVPANAEVKAFIGNGKEKYVNVQEVDYVQEVLWIK